MTNLSWNEIQGCAVDELYSIKPFATDADRVAMLVEKYKEKVS